MFACPTRTELNFSTEGNPTPGREAMCAWCRVSGVFVKKEHLTKSKNLEITKCYKLDNNSKS